MNGMWSDGRSPGATIGEHGRFEGSGVPRSPARRRFGWVRIVAAGFATVVIAVAAGFALFLASLERLERAPARPRDGIVALTGGQQRVGDAIDLLARGFARRLLITGVNEKTSRDEIARLNPFKRELLACCVDLDYRARNTIGNALETRRWAQEHDFRSLIVVTSNYHMPRTLAELDQALPGTEKVAFPVVIDSDEATWRQKLMAARLLAVEYAKYVFVLVRMRVASAPYGDAEPRPAPPERQRQVESTTLVALPPSAR